MSEKFRREVNKKTGKNTIARGNEILAVKRWESGSLSLDVECGGGLPEERIISFVGDWSSGKTALALMSTGNYQRKYPEREVYWIDAEGAWDPKWAASLGVDVNKIFVVRPEHAQEAYNIVLSAVEDNAGLIVIDSLAALSPKEELEGSMEDVTVALMARLNSKFMRKLKKAADEDDGFMTTLLYINQYRINVGGYGAPKVEPGGEALVYYPSLKVVLRKGDLFDGKKIYKSVTANDEGVEVKAQAIKFYTEKNKTAPFKRRGHFWFYFDTLDGNRRKGSVDRLEEIIRLAKKYGVVQQRASAFDIADAETGEVRTFKGSAALAEYIRSDEKVKAFVETEVLKRVVEDMTDVEPQEKARAESVPEEQLVGFDPNTLDDDKKERARSSEAV